MEYFPVMELMGKVKLRSHPVYVVENRRKSPQYTFYFDVETGLLIQIGVLLFQEKGLCICMPLFIILIRSLFRLSNVVTVAVPFPTTATIVIHTHYLCILSMKII